MKLPARPRKIRPTFGVGEWYGRRFTGLTPEQRRTLALQQPLPGKGKTAPECPFQSPGHLCNKVGGVCTIRLYERTPNGKGQLVTGPKGRLRTVCPNRFEQDDTIYAWIGETILGTSSPLGVEEVGFLEQSTGTDAEDKDAVGRMDDVGRIDKVLIVPDSDPLAWCALEKQAVYFSGASMTGEWNAIVHHPTVDLPFPAGRRHPDYRSSGPKRLMPQLQIKVPSLRRWGKKMAVVVDIDFKEALGEMDHVSSVSNCDIAWFVVRYEETQNGVTLVPHEVQLTTLERAVEGLTAGLPVSLEIFEERIRSKLHR